MSATSRAPKTPRDDPPRALLPTFSGTSPSSPEETEEQTPPPPATEAPSSSSSSPPSTVTPFPPTMAAGRSAVRLGLDETSRDDRGTRTGTSSGGDTRPVKLTASEATKLIVGVVAGVAALAALAVRVSSKGQRRLRQPTPEQQDQIAAPVARILNRRANLAMLGPDIGDALAAAAALGEYIGAGPLVERAAADPNLPPVNQPEE